MCLQRILYCRPLVSGWVGGQSVSLSVVLGPFRGIQEQIASGSLYSCPCEPHPLPPCPAHLQA